MARKSSLEACLICGEAPCICGKPASPPKKVTPKRAEPKVKEEAPLVRRKPRASLLHLMKQEAETAPEVPLPRLEPKPKGKKTERRTIEVSDSRTEDEIIFSAAIKAFGPLMHPDEKEKHKMILNSGPITLEEKRVMWKAGRREM